MNSTLDYLRGIRRYLHQHPELSGLEVETSTFLITELEKLNPSQIIKGLGGNGILVVFDSDLAGDSLLFRAELDGLPITDTSESAYQSKNIGFGHQCGHDGHMAILLGLATYLSENLPKKGKVSLLFQPAEEIGEGAKAVIEDEKFKKLNFDSVFALHNLPGFPINSIIVRENAVTAAVESLVIKLEGKTAHAAEPENGLNPALAVAEIIQKVDQLNNNSPKDKDFKLATLVHCKIGELAYGVSAGGAEVHFTLRSWSDENLNQLKSAILSLANSIAIKHHLKTSHFALQSFSANINDLVNVAIVRKAAQQTGLQLIEIETPFKWGEDFGLFTQKFKGCLFGLGSGENQAALHHPDYDFPDEIIESGIEIFKSIIQQKTKL